MGARYARAFFDLADDSKLVAVAEADLKTFKTMLAESPELRHSLASPVIGAEDKGKVVKALADAAHVNSMTKKFMGLLAANGRVAALPAVIVAFEALAAERRGAIAAEVVTAVKLTAAQQKGVAAALRQALGKDPEITTRVDPSILGGLKVRVGSRLFDASLKSRLDQLKFALKRA